MRQPPARLLAALTLAGALYVAVPATVYRGDGMAYADLLRHPERSIANPNHLLYGIAGRAAHRLAGDATPSPDPIVTLQHMGVATALICLGLFYALLRAEGISPGDGAAFTLCLAFTAGFWLQAISPETFLLSMTLEVLVFLAASRYLAAPSLARCAGLGAACGLAVLGTEVDLLLAGGAAWAVARAGGSRRLRQGLAAAGAFILVAAPGFAAAGVLAGVTGGGIVSWMLGRARSTTYLGFSPGNLARDLQNMIVNLYPGLANIGSILRGAATWRSIVYALLLAISLAAFARLALRASRGGAGVSPSRRILMQAIALYLAGLTIFFTFWANALSEFWANHWLAIWCLVALASSPAPTEPPLRRPEPRALAACLGLISLLFLALPLHDSDEGRMTEELRRRVEPGDLLLVTWDEDLESAASVRRSTFAVNVETYLNREVLWAGCWRRPSGLQCRRSGGVEEILLEVRAARAQVRHGWLLDVSAGARPAPAAGSALGTLEEEFAVEAVYRAGEGSALRGATLRPLGLSRPPEDPR